MYKLIFVPREDCSDAIFDRYVFQETLKNEKEIIDFFKKFKKDIVEIIRCRVECDDKLIIQNLDLLIKDIPTIISEDMSCGDTPFVESFNYNTFGFTIIISKIDENNYNDFVSGLIKKKKIDVKEIEEEIEENFDFIVVDNKKKKKKNVKELEDIGKVN